MGVEGVGFGGESLDPSHTLIDMGASAFGHLQASGLKIVKKQRSILPGTHRRNAQSRVGKHRPDPPRGCYGPFAERCEPVWASISHTSPRSLPAVVPP